MGRWNRGSNRVNRGGSLRNDDLANFRGANRNRDGPGNRNDNQGLRLMGTGSRQGPEAVPSIVSAVPSRRERNRKARGGQQPLFGGQRRRAATFSPSPARQRYLHI